MSSSRYPKRWSLPLYERLLPFQCDTTYTVIKPNEYLGVMALLRPLLLDVVPNVQQTAALALGRLANYNDDLAEAVVKGDILPQLVYSLAEQNVSDKHFLYIYCFNFVVFQLSFFSLKY